VPRKPKVIPSQEAITEWSESLVTQYVCYLFENYRDALQDVQSTEVYHPYEPQKTQEVLANINGAVDAWETAIDALNGEREFYEYSEDES
jgi:hypothetical protein